MVPHKSSRGAAALTRLALFEGVPPAQDKVKKMVVPAALRVLRLKPGRKYCTLKRLSHEVGWGYKDVVDKLEEKRKAKGQAYHERKVSHRCGIWGLRRIEWLTCTMTTFSRSPPSSSEKRLLRRSTSVPPTSSPLTDTKRITCCFLEHAVIFERVRLTTSPYFPLPSQLVACLDRLDCEHDQMVDRDCPPRIVLPVCFTTARRLIHYKDGHGYRSVVVQNLRIPSPPPTIFRLTSFCCSVLSV